MELTGRLVVEGLTAAKLLVWVVVLADIEERVLEMLEGRNMALLAEDGAVLIVEGRLAGSFFVPEFDNIALVFFLAGFEAATLALPSMTLLAFLVVTGDWGSTNTVGSDSPTFSMASSRASIASTESSIRVIGLAGDLATMFSTKKSSLA